MIRTFIQFLSILLAVGSSILLLKGNFGLSPALIRELAAPKLTINPETVWSLASQRADTRVGIALLLTSVVLQLGNASWSYRFKDFGVEPVAILLAIGVSAFTVASAWHLADRLAEHAVAKVRAQVESENPNESTPDSVWRQP